MCKLDPRTAKQAIGRIAAAGTLGGLAGGLLAERLAAWVGVSATLPALAVAQAWCAWSIPRSFSAAEMAGHPREGERLPAEARDALTVATALRERMPGVVVSVSTDLDAALAEGGEIRFGSAKELDLKVTAAKTVLADVDLACLETLDVRVPGSPALTRNQTCS